ncbi:hypothetical protein BsWGS_15952 [Bradybaena similaris]
MGARLLVCVFIGCVLARAAEVAYNNNNINPVPLGWENMCTYRTDSEIVKSYSDATQPGSHVVRLQCHVTGNAENTWHFQTLRDWLRGIPDISVFVDVSCSNGGQISLPWPMKANGVVGIIVSGCLLSGKYADFGNPDIFRIPDQLRVLEIRNSVWLNDESGYERLRRGLVNLTSDYDCGQDSTIEYLVTNNVSDAVELSIVSSHATATHRQFKRGFHLDVNRVLGLSGASISDSSEFEARSQDHYLASDWLDMDLDTSDREDMHSFMGLFSPILPTSELNDQESNHPLLSLFNFNIPELGSTGRQNGIHSLTDPLKFNLPIRELNARQDSIHSAGGLSNSKLPTHGLAPGKFNSHQPTRDLVPGNLNSHQPTRDLVPGNLNSHLPTRNLAPGNLNSHLPTRDLSPGNLNSHLPTRNLAPGNLNSHLPTRDLSPGNLNSHLPTRNLAPESDGTTSASAEFNELLQKLLSLSVTCNYEKLRTLDESNPQLLPIQHFTLMVQGARYPELRVMNYSSAGIREMPQELQDFRMYFPKLQYLDLSRNFLTKIPLTSRYGEASVDSLTLDVRGNLISSISVDDLLLWAQNTDVFVDIRNNPLHCGCQMMHFLQKIKSEAFFAGNLRRYKYVRDLQCASPSHLRGKKLSEINLRCTAEINLAAAPKTWQPSAAVLSTTNIIIIGSLSAFLVISFIVLVVFFIVYNRLGKGTSKKHVVTNKSRELSQDESCIINVEYICTKV